MVKNSKNIISKTKDFTTDMSLFYGNIFYNLFLYKFDQSSKKFEQLKTEFEQEKIQNSKTKLLKPEVVQLLKKIYELEKELEVYTNAKKRFTLNNELKRIEKPIFIKEKNFIKSFTKNLKNYLKFKNELKAFKSEVKKYSLMLKQQTSSNFVE